MDPQQELLQEMKQQILITIQRRRNVSQFILMGITEQTNEQWEELQELRRSEKETLTSRVQQTSLFGSRAQREREIYITRLSYFKILTNLLATVSLNLLVLLALENLASFFEHQLDLFILHSVCCCSCVVMVICVHAVHLKLLSQLVDYFFLPSLSQQQDYRHQPEGPVGFILRLDIWKINNVTSRQKNKQLLL